MSQPPLPKFYNAITHNDVATLQQILLEYPGFHQERVGLDSWLQIAARYADIAVVEFLARAGLDVTPALGDAVLYERLDVARWLLDHGATIVPPNPLWGGPLLVAVATGSVEMVRLLLERGADANASWGSPPVSALSDALSRGAREIADLLRAHGATLPAVEPTKPPTARDEVIGHFESRIGSVDPLGITEVVPGEVAIWIHIVPAGPGHEYVLLFTTGMSDLPLNVPPGREDDRFAELMMLLPSGWPLNREALADPRNGWPIEWLRRSAHFFHEHRTWIGPGYGVVNGNPPKVLAPGLAFDSLLLLHTSSDTSRVRVADGRLIRFHTAYPLHPGERVMETEQGPASLLELLTQQPTFPVVDIRRPSVAG